MSLPSLSRRVALMQITAGGLAMAASGARAQSSQTEENSMSSVRLFVLYPQPTDAAAFDADYIDHVALLR